MGAEPWENLLGAPGVGHLLLLCALARLCARCSLCPLGILVGSPALSVRGAGLS